MPAARTLAATLAVALATACGAPTVDADRGLPANTRPGDRDTSEPGDRPDVDGPSFDRDTSEPGDRPDVDGPSFDRVPADSPQVEEAVADARALLGTDEDALELSAEQRVVRRGDEHFAVTEDLHPGRRNLELDATSDGTFHVTAVTVETEDGPIHID